MPRVAKDPVSKDPRVSKDPEERRAEILSTAAELFARHGFARTAVSDIVNAMGVAQGTFYYYFKSKEDVFLAVFEKRLKELVQRLWRAMEKDTRGSVERLNALIAALLGESAWEEDDPLLRELHSPENAGLHQKFSATTVKVLAPLFATVIEQGIREGVFSIHCPQEAAEFALSGTLVWLDPLIFDWTRGEFEARVRALPHILEQVLGAAEGTLAIPGDHLGRQHGGDTRDEGR